MRQNYYSLRNITFFFFNCHTHTNKFHNVHTRYNVHCLCCHRKLLNNLQRQLKFSVKRKTENRNHGSLLGVLALGEGCHSASSSLTRSVSFFIFFN
ncbi:hypothetical protein PUN28_013974 [Cardiocondyla obscurior]|uniref:Uncharacterized protein n=1 Tax=Cardiocondyla obscurior TaxID=286306 RepID=A0AAW2F6L0_9HYME